MSPKPTTIKELLDSLPPERKTAITALRKTIKASLDKKFKEGIQYGMLAYFLPHTEYPEGYHCDPAQPLPFVAVASQKNHIGLYLFCVYCSAEEQVRFKKEWRASGKKLDMGKSCVRVKGLDDLPLEVVGRSIKRMTAKKFVTAYEEALPASVKAKRGAGKKKPAAKKKTVKKPATKKKAARKARAAR